MKRFWGFLALSVLWPFVAAAQAFHQNDLETLLDKNPQTNKPVSSVAELIPLLPSELRENFTFVYASRSPFAASITPEFPRTILFSKDGRLVITFTGNPDKPGFNLLEYMCFDDATATFKLGARQLGEGVTTLRAPATSLTESCTKCHGHDPRPINDSYPIWPGFYGSVRDTFPQELAVSRRELENYKKFLNGEAKKGVYKDLVFATGSPVPPYEDPAKFDPSRFVGELASFQFLPNTRFGMALTELNRKRILRKLHASPHFVKNEKKILAELLDCGKSNVTSKDVARVEGFVREENKSRLVRLGITPQDKYVADNDMQELKFARNLAQIDWVSSVSNVSRADWAMALEENSFAFFDGILSGIYKKKNFYIKEDLIYELLGHVADTEPKFEPYFQPTPDYSSYGYPFGKRLNLGAAMKACRFLPH